jgi:hypothetical protein
VPSMASTAATATTQRRRSSFMPWFPVGPCPAAPDNGA